MKFVVWLEVFPVFLESEIIEYKEIPGCCDSSVSIGQYGNNYLIAIVNWSLLTILTSCYQAPPPSRDITGLHAALGLASFGRSWNFGRFRRLAAEVTVIDLQWISV